MKKLETIATMLFWYGLRHSAHDGQIKIVFKDVIMGYKFLLKILDNYEQKDKDMKLQ